MSFRLGACSEQQSSWRNARLSWVCLLRLTVSSVSKRYHCWREVNTVRQCALLNINDASQHPLIYGLLVPDIFDCPEIYSKLVMQNTHSALRHGAIWWDWIFSACLSWEKFVLQRTTGKLVIQAMTPRHFYWADTTHLSELALEFCSSLIANLSFLTSRRTNVICEENTNYIVRSHRSWRIPGGIGLCNHSEVQKLLW